MTDKQSADGKPHLISIDESVHGVHGYGTMNIGVIRRMEGCDRYEARVWGEVIGQFRKLKDGVAAALEFWHQTCSKESLARRFESRTKGHLNVKFLHQTGRTDTGNIVASVRSIDGSWASTSFGLDGKCRLSDQSDWDLIPK